MRRVLIISRLNPPIRKKRGKPVYKNRVIDVIALGDTQQYNRKTGDPYPTFNLKTEKQLVQLIKERYGKGRYAVVSNHRGKFYVFFKGTVDETGWTFEPQNYMKKEMEWIDKEIDKAEDDEDINFWEAEKSQIKEDLKKEKKSRYGFEPYLKPFGRRGTFHHWEDDPVPKIKKQYTSKGKLKKMEDMNIDELNEF